MAQNTLFDENEFEKKRDEILKMEKDAEWKLAKQFERTEIYRANSGGKDTIKVAIATYDNTIYSYNLISSYSVYAT